MYGSLYRRELNATVARESAHLWDADPVAEAGERTKKPKAQVRGKTKGKPPSRNAKLNEG